MINKSLLAVGIAASLAVVSAPSFAGYVCGTDSLTGYVKVSNFATTAATQNMAPGMDGIFNATLRDLNGTINCEVPVPLDNYPVSVYGALSLDTNVPDGITNYNLNLNLSSPLSIFSGLLAIIANDPLAFPLSFTAGNLGALDGGVIDTFKYTIDYDGNISTSLVALLNNWLPANQQIGNTNGSGKLVVEGDLYSDGITMKFTDTPKDWMGFEKMMLGADMHFDDTAYAANGVPTGKGSWGSADANFILTDAGVHIPEPASLALLGLGLMGLGLARRRRAA